MKKTLIITVLLNLVITSSLLVGFSVFALSPVVYKSYPDVPKDLYYADPISRMSLLEILNGYKNGNFGPDDVLSRGQMAVVMDRYNDRMNDEIGKLSSEIYENAGTSYSKILQQKFGLKYTCPEKASPCTGNLLKDPTICDDSDYVKFVKSNCSLKNI